MDVFISYARSDAAAAHQLQRDIERSHHSVWFDRELEGGQVWWNEILERIRSSDLFLFALSEDSVHSRACCAELDYAMALHRPVLPVRVGDVDMNLAPDPLPSLQVIDYRQRTPDDAIELHVAINRRSTPAPLPERAPDPPRAPLRSFAPLQELLAGRDITYTEQVGALRELRERITNADERDAATSLLHELRARPEVVESVARDIDAVLSRLAAASPGGLGPPELRRDQATDLLRSVVTHIRNGHCTPIVGSGLTDSLIGPRHLLARQWAETFEFPMAAHQQEDLPQVAEFVAVMTDVGTLRESLREFYRAQLVERYPELLSSDRSTSLRELVRQAWSLHCSKVELDAHLVLADLPCSIYVTTHPSNLLSEALEMRGKDPVVELCHWRPEVDDWPDSVFDGEPAFVPDVQRPLVFHVFGNMNFIDSMVITEDDYFDFLAEVAANPPLIPLAVRDALADSALILLGFRLDELDVRVLLRSLISQPGGKRLQKYTHVAAQIELGDHVVSPARARRFLERYFGKHRQPSIDIFWGTVDEFAAGLVEVWTGTR
jgi:hypothetical protein